MVREGYGLRAHLYILQCLYFLGIVLKGLLSLGPSAPFLGPSDRVRGKRKTINLNPCVFTLSSPRSLDLTGPLLLGGVPDLPESFPVRMRHFVGCMKDLQVDSRHIDMADFIANNGTVPGMRTRGRGKAGSQLPRGSAVRDLGTSLCGLPVSAVGP